MITGEDIRRRRIELGVSQEALAYICGLTAKTIHNIERGHVVARPDTLRALGRALGLEG